MNMSVISRISFILSNIEESGLERVPLCHRCSLEPSRPRTFKSLPNPQTLFLCCDLFTGHLNGSQFHRSLPSRPVSAYRRLLREDVEPDCASGNRSPFLSDLHGCTAQFDMHKPFTALATSVFFLNCSVCIYCDIHYSLPITN